MFVWSLIHILILINIIVSDSVFLSFLSLHFCLSAFPFFQFIYLFLILASMAGESDVPDDCSDIKLSCCKAKIFKCSVCVNCGAAYHQGCIKGKFKILDQTRVICCDKISKTPNGNSNFTLNVQQENQLLKSENEYLKRLIEKLELNTTLLAENNMYLKEKINLQANEISQYNSGQVKISSTNTQTYAKTVQGHQVQRNPSSAKKPAQLSITTINTPTISDGEMANNLVQLENSQLKLMRDVINLNDKSPVTNNLQPPNLNISKKFDNKSNNKNKDTKKKIVLMGTNKGTNLSVVPKMEWYFVSRLSKNTSADDIKNHLQSIKKCDIYKVEYMKPKTDEHTYNSFKIGIPANIAKECMCPESWPDGCILNRFFFSKNSPVHLKNTENIQQHEQEVQKQKLNAI